MTALEKMASLHTESDEYHSTKLEKCCRVCAKVKVGRAVHADVDCEVCNTLLAQSKGGRQKTAKKCGRLNRESSKGIANSFLKNAHGEGRNNCMWYGFYHLPQVSLFLICCAWCVTASLTVPWGHCAGRWSVHAHCISGLVLE